MNSLRPFTHVLGLAALLGASSWCAAAADTSRRLFDFAPVSAANPVVATIDGVIAIPLSELRAYRDAERLQAITDPASLAQKHAVLDALIDEYLYVDDAYRHGVPESPAFARRLEATRTMILTDLMAVRAAAEKKDAAQPDDEAATALAEKLFEAASIEVSNENYATFKQAAKAIDRASSSLTQNPELPPSGETAAKLQGIIEAVPRLTLARYEGRAITVPQLLSIYAGLPVTRRPRVAEPAGLIEMMKPLILPELMALETARRGIGAEPAFQQKLTQNRNALLRFHVHGAIESRANDELRSPDLEARLRAWYRANPTLYAATPEGGSGGVLQPFEAVRERVLGDFSVELRDRLRAEKARELRQQRRIEIDEAALRTL